MKVFIDSFSGEVSELKGKNRKLTLSDEVFNGLKKMGNGSASQAVTDLYQDKVKSLTLQNITCN